MHQTIDNLLDGFGPDATAQDSVNSLADFFALMHDRNLINPRWPVKRLSEIRAAALRLCKLPPEKIEAGIPTCLEFSRERFGDAATEEAEAMIEATAGNSQAAHGVRCWNAALAITAAEDAIDSAAAAPLN